MKRNIVLTGFMGTGKTAVGKHLSKYLQMDFVDTDEEIEKATGLKISEIFRKHGERYFRKEESLVVEKVAEQENCVIATGGGIVLNADNMRRLRKKGFIILLEARPEVIARRVCQNEERPLLASHGDLVKRIAALLKERASFYEECDFKINTSALSFEEVAGKALSFLEGQGWDVKGGQAVESLRVNLGERSYEILIGSGVLHELGRYLLPFSFAPQVFLITNETVGKLYGAQVTTTLARAGFEVLCYEVPDGEEYKSLDSAYQLYDFALERGLERQGAVIALGGGVISDLAGFVAATYMRGVPLVQVPTTLLAQVDSSVGGKVAVNHPKGKNMIGCFYQPRLVYTDVATLKTLPLRELRAGLAEVIKYGVIWDEGLFCFLEENLGRILALEQEVLVRVARQCCIIKAKVVEKDEKELGLRAILNFGHTVGHALEALTNYQVYRHGEAIAVGMVVAATIAVKRGLLAPESRKRLVSLLERIDLPTRVPYAAEEVIEIIRRDKKVQKGRIRFVLPLTLGHVEIFSDLEPAEIKAALEDCQEKGGKRW